MNPQVRQWLFVVASAATLAGALVIGIETPEFNCPFGVCEGSGFVDVRIRRVAADRHRRSMWVAMREASDLALAARVLPPPGPSGEAPVWFEPGLQDGLRRSIQSRLADEFATHGTRPGRALIGVLVIADTARTLGGVTVGWRNSAGYTTRALLPSPPTRGRCVAVVRLHASVMRHGIGSASSPNRPLLDACGFYDAFGAPGPRIAATLGTGRYHVARAYMPRLPDELRTIYSRWSLVGGPYESNSDASFLCVAGADSACAAQVVGLAAQRPHESFEWFGRGDRAPLPATTETYEPAASSLFTMLARDLGPERFIGFWQSDAPMAEAYRTAAGRPLSDFAREHAGWVTGVLGARSGFGSRLSTAPTATASSAGLIVLTIGVLLYAATALTRRPDPS